MVKKLFKHELLSYMRVVVPMHIILLAIALITRIIQIFENDSSTYNTIIISSIIIFIISTILCFVLTYIIGIKRFYTNMFSNEGYLTHTLPVSTTQHIVVKTTTAVLATIFSALMIFVSICTITFGDVCNEIFKSIGYILGKSFDQFGYNLIFYIIEFALLAIIAITASYLLIYGCISIGQRAKKNRVAWAVGTYFIYYIITQIIGTAFIITLNNLEGSALMTGITNFIENNQLSFVHIVLCGFAVYYAILGTIFFFITRYTISKKLNLE